ncbi:hypothetical protein FB451DRAFT_1397908 [Mycena latifolia]|nr:hypothetical protein FB451DRAFT_1397871 [Mycena latifolia]KAJ7475036.1 hypothetical protein FB451DRAFT_1397908 [Mycena latifolia]
MISRFDPSGQPLLLAFALNHEIRPRRFASLHSSSASPYAPYTSSSQAPGGQALEAPWAPPARKEDGFVAYSIDIRDKESVDLRPHLDAACVYIKRALRRGEAVLGVSRSPSIVIAYLIRNHAMSHNAALAFVKRKPNPGFARALIEWEHSWRRPAVQRRVCV